MGVAFHHSSLLSLLPQVVEEMVEVNAKRITGLGISLAGGDQLQPEVGGLGAGSHGRRSDLALLQPALPLGSALCLRHVPCASVNARSVQVPAHVARLCC